VPRPPFPSAPSGPKGNALLSRVRIDPGFDGKYELHVEIVQDGRRYGGSARFPYSTPLGDFSFPCPATGAPIPFTSADIFDFLAAAYDLERASSRLLEQAASGAAPRVAFTVSASSVKGGGSIMLFRLVNWLSDLGVEVTVYSDDALPDWTSVNARFHRAVEPADRYGAITEPVVIVFSILELPQLLRHPQNHHKRIFHLCQGAEDFHFGPPPAGGLFAPNAAFDLLNSIPVGRLVVSPHLERYFAKKYGQRALLIPNGIDLELFSPGPKPPPSGQLTVVCTGSPVHPLKGVGVVKAALTLLARRHPEWRLHFVNVCGLQPKQAPEPGGAGFTGEYRYGISGPQMRDLLRSADAYVNASWYEGFGLPSMEAMACGLPVVQSDNAGLEGVAQDGRDCLVAKVGDPESVAAALERVLGDAALRARLVQGGLETAAGCSLAQQRAAMLTAFSTITGVDLAARARPAPPPGSPAFSVLVPVVGAAPNLGEALESLLRQVEPGWEALVVHDGADAGAATLIERMARQDGRIRALARPGATVAAALAAGLGEARAPRICWLAPDELFLPEKLALHLQAERLDPGLRFSYTSHRSRRVAGGPQPADPIAAREVPPVDLQVLQLLQRNYVSSASAVVHREVLDAVGGIGEGPPGALALSLWLRASLRFRSRFLDAETCVLPPSPSAGAARDAAAAAAKAALGFLETTPFPDLFPMLDLGQTDQAIHAVVTALRLATAQDSLLRQARGEALLLERAAGWLASRASPPVQAACRLALLQVGRGSVTRELRAGVAMLVEAASQDREPRPARSPAAPA
jgi:glycosyltransferase involved in cell wall biosynthesis